MDGAQRRQHVAADMDERVIISPPSRSCRPRAGGTEFYRWKSSLVMKGEVVTHQLDRGSREARARASHSRRERLTR
jgi:hypothetical protein